MPLDLPMFQEVIEIDMFKYKKINFEILAQSVILKKFYRSNKAYLRGQPWPIACQFAVFILVSSNYHRCFC